MTHARHRLVAELSPGELAARRADQRMRTAAYRARKRAALAPDARPLRAPVDTPDPSRLDITVRMLVGRAWTGRHRLVLPPSAGQLDTLDARWARLGLGDRIRLADRGHRALDAAPARKRGALSWRTWAAVLVALDAALAELRAIARAAVLSHPSPVVAHATTGALLADMTGEGPPGADIFVRAGDMLARLADRRRRLAELRGG